MKQPSSDMNIPATIASKLSVKNHLRPNHPVEIIKRMLWGLFDESYNKYDNMDPWVSVQDNFDELLIPSEHPSRRVTDTYYQDADTVLRTHMTAHLVPLALQGERHLVCGDVYRKDTVDATHYPVFTQMDGYCLLEDHEDPTEALKGVLARMIEKLFPGAEYRFSEDYFPFTINSIEAEVLWNGQWLEILGGGTVHPTIMNRLGLLNKKAWAFGVGLDRLAMILFNIPDIRLMWTEDPRFMNQFTSGEMVEFQPYSKHPPCLKDIAFWLPEGAEKDGEWTLYNDFCELVREVGEDLVEDVTLLDRFENKQGRVSRCYRLTYRASERSLRNGEVDALQMELRKQLGELGVSVR